MVYIPNQTWGNHRKLIMDAGVSWDGDRIPAVCVRPSLTSIDDPHPSNTHTLPDQITDVRVYRYYSPETLSLDFSGMLEDLSNAPDGAVVLLHTTGHNPCGFDPSHEEWQRLAALCQVGEWVGWGRW